MAVLFIMSSTVLSEDQAGTSVAESSATRRIVQYGTQATVGLACKISDYASFYGTGSVISADGYILTSTTVVPTGAQEIKVVFDGPVVRDAKIVETNDVTEAALLKVEATDLPHFSVATDLPRVGETAYTFSNANNIMPRGGRASFSEGIISGVYQVGNLGGESTYAGPAIETTAAINPGSDGGPIVNEQGQLCAIVSLNVSPQRWMGVGVPAQHVLGQFDVERIKVDHQPILSQPPGDSDWSAVADAMSRFLVGIEVQREYPAEMLPRIPWREFLEGINDWEKKSAVEKTQTMARYNSVSRLMEVNQMLRRPAEPVTGVVISPDGHILTSAFNVGDDIIFRNKNTKKVPEWKFTIDAEQLTKDNKDLVGGKNQIKKIVARLNDGSEHEAKLLARHVPLGIALLKIDAKDLPYLELSQLATEPRLGVGVGVMGMMGGALTPYTMNTGIVSSPKRDLGYRFQTDALLNYGNSGGPVVTQDGQFLGIAAEPIRPQTVAGRIFGQSDLVRWPVAPNSGVGMVCRADRLLEALSGLKAGESSDVPRGGILGVQLDPSNAFANQAIIGAVIANSPAKKAGLQKGDRILEIDGRPLSSWGELTEAVLACNPGDKVQLLIQRKNIVRHLLIKGQKVANQAGLDELMKKLKPGEKFEGELIQSDKKVIEVTLGERK